MRRHEGLRAGVIAASTLVPLIGQAQNEPTPTPVAEEVVVTAQRRPERLSEVPISISVISGEQMTDAGIGGTTDLGQVTPGLQFSTNGAYAQPTIRGIGSSITSAGSDSNVAIYVDGVYMPNQNANFFELADVQQIEVLKGPQGTLYGRNATGGAINVTTRAPSNDLDGKLALSYGSFSERKVSGFLGGPLVEDTLLGSLAVNVGEDDGYVDNLFDGSKLASRRDRGGRGKLRWNASDALTFTLSGDFNDTRDLRGYSLKPLNGNVSIPNLVVSPDDREVSLNTRPEFHTRVKGGSLTATYDFDAALFTSISSWRDTDVDILTDLDRTAAANTWSSFEVAQETLTQEFNLTSQAEARFKWVTGVYYYDDDARQNNLRISGTQTVDSAQVTSETWAVYAQGDYRLFDQLTLIAGARYNSEKRGLHARRSVSSPREIETSDTFTSPTYRAALRYDFDNRSNVYASWSTGFKSGTYNATAFTTTPVDPENIDAYEVGYKYMASGLDVTAAAFYYDYKDIQVQAVTPATGLTTLSNAAAGESYGLEGQVGLPLNDYFTVTAGAAWTHATYSSFPNALLTTPRPTGGNTQGRGIATGNDMIRTPDVTANLTLAYAAPLWGGSVQASLNEYYNSGFYWEAGNRLKQKAYHLVNAQVGWEPESARWRISAWVRNLTDTTYQMYVVDTTAADAVSYSPPRQVGMTFEVRL